MGYLWNSSIKGWEGEHTYDSDCLAPETIKVHRKQCMQICLNDLGGGPGRLCIGRGGQGGLQASRGCPWAGAYHPRDQE